jgi:hypothetical protein
MGGTMQAVNFVRIDREDDDAQVSGIMRTLTCAHTRVKFYGESLTLAWLEDLMEQVSEAEDLAMSAHDYSYEKGYEDGYEQATLEQADREREANAAIEKAERIRRALKNILEETT